MKYIKRNLILILILTLAACLRLIRLDSIPIGFNDDEAAFGYNAYSILKTGRDEWGRLLPFPVFESFGDWKLVGYLYLTVISQFFFGVNEFATRLPSAIFGVLTVFATYLLTKELFKKSNFQFSLAHLSALMLAISPWHIAASRNAFESDLLSFFITIGTYWFLKGLTNHGKFLTLAFAAFAINFYFYRSSWLFIPVFGFTILYLHKEYLVKFKSLIFKNILLFIILSLPLIPSVLTFRGQSRFFQESFIAGVSRIGIINEVNQARGICKSHVPKVLCLIIYNKYIYFTKAYISNYIQNLSYAVFFENASPTGFQSFAKRGVFYLVDLPLLVFGFIFLFKDRSPAIKILIPWILIAPIGAAFAGVGNYGRINLIMPALQIAAAFGVSGIVRAVRWNLAKISLGAVISAVIIFSLVKLIIDIFYIEPYFVSSYQRFGYKQLFYYLDSQKNNYDYFYISGKIDSSHQYIQYLYFLKIDPEFYFNNVERERGKDGWINLRKIGNFNFVSSVPGPETLLPRALLTAGNKETEFPAKPIKTINYVNGDVGFEIYDIDEVKRNLEKLKNEE